MSTSINSLLDKLHNIRNSVDDMIALMEVVDHPIHDNLITDVDKIEETTHILYDKLREILEDDDIVRNIVNNNINDCMIAKKLFPIYYCLSNSFSAS
jgi:GTP-dependent phosphoenolpyruvate carboxykinase